MRNWRTFRFDEIADIQLGKMLSPKSRTGLCPFPYLRNANVQWNRFDLDVMAEMDFSDEERRKFRLRKGDILICEGGEPGRSAVWNDEIEECYFQKAIHRVRLHDPNASPYFFLYRLWSAANSGEFTSGNAKTTIAHLPLNRLSALKISIPNAAEQHSIAKTVTTDLSHARKAAEASLRRNDLSRVIESEILKSKFFGGVPLSIGVPLQSAPAGWRWRRLTDLALLESGHTPSRKRPDWWGGEIPWIALPDIRKLDGRVAQTTLERTNALGIANSSARILPVDTVVLSRTASVGYVTILGREMATSQDFVNWICGPELEPRFLLHALRGSRDYLVANASGAIHRTLYMPAVKDFHLCLPDLAEQRRLAGSLDESLAAQRTLLDASRRELAAIEALPAAILRTVFTDAA